MSFVPSRCFIVTSVLIPPVLTVFINAIKIGYPNAIKKSRYFS